MHLSFSALVLLFADKRFKSFFEPLIRFHPEMALFRFNFVNFRNYSITY